MVSFYNDTTSEIMQGFQEVPPDDEALFHIESIAIATTPGILDTGSVESFTQFLVSGGTPRAFVSYNKVGKRVGYVAVSLLVESECMEVRSLAVLPEYQRQGHGKKMMVEVEAIAKTYGRNRMMLATSPDNARAVTFYKALGYVITKTVQNYYGDGTPRHILEKQLGSS